MKVKELKGSNQYSAGFITNFNHYCSYDGCDFKFNNFTCYDEINTKISVLMQITPVRGTGVIITVCDVTYTVTESVPVMHTWPIWYIRLRVSV